MALEYPLEHPAVLFQSIGMPANTRIDAQTLERFGKVLMIIAGADNHLSMWERGWLTAYMAAYGAGGAVIKTLDDFDYKSAELDPLLDPLLQGPYARWVRRSLVQGAIRMSRADDLSPAEYRAILYAAELLNMNEDVVHEVQSLLDVFDTVNLTNATLLTVAELEDAENMDSSTDAVTASWSDSQDTLEIEPGYVPTTPEWALLASENFVFARAILYVMSADGIPSSDEMEQFIAYMRSWGASEAQIRVLISDDYRSLTAEDIVAQSGRMQWGLTALTSVALRIAGADDLSHQEEAALLNLYRQMGQSAIMYHATKGLETVRRQALDRLNAIFARYV